MPKRAGIVDRTVLINAPLPDATETYTVISHGSVINNILQTLQEKGFQVAEEIYKCNDGAQVASGIFRLNYGEDPDLGMMFAFANSYDKSMRFKCAVGGYVHVNGASIIGSNMSSWGRKHTGTADNETAETIQKQLEDAEAYFSQLLADKERMKETLLTDRQFAELLGVLYVEKKILSGEQLSLIRTQFEKPKYTYNAPANSLWTLYNHIILALAKSHPRTWMDQQKIVHFHLISEYNISEFDPEEEETEATEEQPQAAEETSGDTTEPVQAPVQEVEEVKPAGPKVIVNTVPTEPEPEKDPNQFDLAEQAAQVEAEGVDNIAEVQSPLLPGFGGAVPKKAEPAKMEDLPDSVTETKVMTRAEVVEEYPEMEEKIMQSAIEEPEEVEVDPEDIFISKVDIHDMFPDVTIGEDVTINDVPFTLISSGEMQGIDGYYLRQVGEMPEGLISDSEEEVEEEQPEMEPPHEHLAVVPDVDPEEVTRISKESLDSFFPGVQVNDHVELEGFEMKVYSEDGDDFLLIPAAGSGDPAAAADPVSETVEETPPVKPEPVEKPEPEVVTSKESEPVEFLNEPQEEPAASQEASGDPEAGSAQPEPDSDEDDKIRSVISKELYDLYGTFVEYNYEVADSQYNVTLATGETIVLLKEEIDKRAAKE